MLSHAPCWFHNAKAIGLSTPALGLTFDEMLDELTEKVQLLTEWKRHVVESLPGQRGAATAVPGAAGPSPKAAHAS
jgi:hypothetical protein